MSETKKVNVILVEDDFSVRMSLTQALELAGLSVVSFDCAEDALRLVQEGFLGVLISDVQLPGMSGLQLLNVVNSKVQRSIPIILVTGHGDEAMAEVALGAGAFGFIEKPFATERLIDTTRNALRSCSAGLDRAS